MALGADDCTHNLKDLCHCSARVAVCARDRCCARRLTCSSNASRSRTRTDYAIEPRGQSSQPNSDGTTVSATRLTVRRDTLREAARDARIRHGLLLVPPEVGQAQCRASWPPVESQIR